MKLTSLIQILFSSVIEEEVRKLGAYRLSFRTKEELESKVAYIYNVFEDSDEAITEPKLVSDWILNKMDIKTYVPNLERVESLFRTKLDELKDDKSEEKLFQDIKKLEKEIKELHKIAQVMAMQESDARKSLQNYKDGVKNA